MKKHIANGFNACFGWVPRLRWYEWVVVILAALILGAAYLAWHFDPDTAAHRIKRAVEIAEPTFIGLGTLSIVLLWVQLRQTNIWNRVVTYHEYFSEIPGGEKRELVRLGFHRVLGHTQPPTFYRPIKYEDAQTIVADKGANSEPPLSAHLLTYLNEFEEFCGAINCGMVDDEYARELEGSRVIDAYFGYVEFINLMRQAQELQVEQRQPSHGPPAYRSKVYLELQKTAIRWHGKRRVELVEMMTAIEDANRKARDVVNGIGQQGVTDKVRN